MSEDLAATVPFTDRPALEAHWLHLTRATLPTVARTRGYPISAHHCFQRVFLDNACGGVWYDTIVRRPAYRHAPEDTLTHAVQLAEAVLAGQADLVALNRQSLAWRGRSNPRTAALSY